MRAGSWLVLIVFNVGLAWAQPTQTSFSDQAGRILVDGYFDDWDNISPLHTDPTSDATPGTPDFVGLWITNDENYLFLRFEVTVETLIQEFNQITFYLDTDDNAATGQAIYGIGAELSWTFGQRSGVFTANGSSQNIGHHVLGIVTAPTVSALAFEVALDRHALPDGQHLLFPGETFRLVLEDGAGGDVLPDAAGGVAFTFGDATGLPPFIPHSLGKQDPAQVRVLSYNVQRDALFDGARQPSFLRLIEAANPDIIGFQEIYGHSAEQTRALVESVLPSSTGQAWYAARVDPDLVIVSRYPVKQSYAIEGSRPGDGNAAFVLDMQAKWGTDVLVLSAHPPCCRADAERQLDIDAMMAFVRDAKMAGGRLDLEAETPIFILGDMNLVGFAEQLNTLLSGTIVNTNRYGSSFSPDWDNSPLTDLSPRHVALPMTFTWYDAFSSFHPGRLDFIIYTDSVLDPGNSYVLFTPAMSADMLATYQLQSHDATTASDHLPVVGDFHYRPSRGSPSEDVPSEVSEAFILKQNYPNPFQGSTQITFEMSSSAHVRLAVYDLTGREVAVLVEGRVAPGWHKVTWTVGESPNGVYFYRMETEGHSVTRAMLHQK